MYHPLAPCPGCRRHARIDDAICPFCATALVGLEARPDREIGRLGRAALLAAASALAHCDKPTPRADVSAEAAVSATPIPDAGGDGDGDVAPDTLPDATDGAFDGPSDAAPDTQRDARPHPAPSPTAQKPYPLDGPHDHGGMAPKYGMAPKPPLD